MPLDPQAKAILDQMVAAGLPALNTLSPEQARELMKGFQPLAGEPEPVSSIENRLIQGPGGEIPVRIYAPKTGGGSLPILVYFHGGGWVIGDLDIYDASCRAIANAANCIVVSVGYRLAPEHKFPAAVDDSYFSTKWVADNAQSIGGDPALIAVGGDSAGGNLAAVVSLIAKERGTPSIAYQVLIYPGVGHSLDTPSFQDYADGYLLTKDDCVWFVNHYLRSEEDRLNPYFSPLRAEDLRGLPPAFVITAEFDPLRDEGELYADRLRDAGVQAKCKRYDGMIHGFLLMAGVIDQGREAITDVGNALREAFAKPEEYAEVVPA